jgi:hypothetical protein
MALQQGMGPVVVSGTAPLGQGSEVAVCPLLASSDCAAWFFTPHLGFLSLLEGGSWDWPGLPVGCSLLIKILVEQSLAIHLRARLVQGGLGGRCLQSPPIHL